MAVAPRLGNAWTDPLGGKLQLWPDHRVEHCLSIEIRSARGRNDHPTGALAAHQPHERAPPFYCSSSDDTAKEITAKLRAFQLPQNSTVGARIRTNKTYATPTGAKEIFLECSQFFCLIRSNKRRCIVVDLP